MYGRKDLVKITTLTNLSAILRTIKKCLGTPLTGLSSTKRFATLTYEGQFYSDKDLANLLNDKFIAVGSSLSTLVWSPLTVDQFPTDFYISVNDIAEALLSSKLHSSAGPDKISA